MTTVQQLPERIRKFIKNLHIRKIRDAEQKFIAEGPKIVQELLNSTFTIELVVVRNDAVETQQELITTLLKQNIPVYTANNYHFEFICDAKSPQGMVAVAHCNNQLVAPVTSFIALDGINDPGNVGTIIRTAHWFGVQTILLNKGSVDRYNPKVVRSTMGSLFHCNVIETDLQQTLTEYKQTHELYGATLEATLPIEECEPQRNFGIIIGSESHGISPAIRKLLSHEYTIMGAGLAESLNAAVAAGISLYHFTMFVE